MLISDSKTFIFVHIEKTAGTSITSALQPHSIIQPTDKWHSLLRSVGLPQDYHRYKFLIHARLTDAQNKLPDEVFKQYYKFAFVRNPWDRLVSKYNSAITKNSRRKHQKIKAMSGFPEYVDYEIKRNKLHQTPMILDKNGENGLDFLGRFENLADDFNHVCETLGIDTRLEKLNAFKHADYRDFYDDATRKKVAKHWAQDIDILEYSF